MTSNASVRASDWSAALGADAQRLEPRITRLTKGGGTLRFFTVALRGDRLTADERAWIDRTAARRDGLTSLELPLGDVALGLHSRVPSLDEPHPLAAILRHLARAVERERQRPLIMGVVNATPDSFSDGGRFAAPEEAIEHGLRLIDEGADILDVGGESTRPGSLPIDGDEELRRVAPVIAKLAQSKRAVISIDTQKSSVARAALDLGATVVNDVSAGRFDTRMFELAAERRCALALMHMQGSPREMQNSPHYERDVVAEVLAFLRERASAAVAAGIAPDKLLVDPGIGFGKKLEHNLALLARVHELRSLGLPLIVGPSRKSFISALEERIGGARAAPSERGGGTAAAVTLAVQGGAEVLRVHDVRSMLQAARVAFAASDASLDFPLA